MFEKEIRQRIEALRLALLEKASSSFQQNRISSSLEPIPIEKIPGFRENKNEIGSYAVIEIPVDDLIDSRRLENAIGKLFEGSICNEIIFLDLETTGFSCCPLFLAGMLSQKSNGWIVEQVIARDYSEEAAIIKAIDHSLSGFTNCITFNGKSFDIPYIRERAKYHRLDFSPPLGHFDLLHHARRKWKSKLPNCRLRTLEYYILGKRYFENIESWEVPCIYHEFVHTSDARRLIGVLRHNLLDIVSTAGILVCIAEV
ncbi:MAG: ribonuclease H-like domain-containing protein [bacterium]